MTSTPIVVESSVRTFAPRQLPPQGAPIVSTGTVGAGRATTIADGVQLSSNAQGVGSNPFEGFASGVSNVTVQPGDSLSKLLMQQGFSKSELGGAIAQVMAANPGIKNPNLIYPDQKLKLPVRSNATEGVCTAQSTQEAGPTISSLPLAEQSQTQLTDTAQGARSKASAHLGELFGTIGTLSKDDQKSLSQAMFYETASASGFYKFHDKDTGMRLATSGEVRSLYANYMDKDARAAAEAKVKGWAAENPIESQNAMASGAADWAAANYDPEASLQRQKTLLSVVQNSNGITQNNTLATDASYELFGRDAEAGKKLFGSINN